MPDCKVDTNRICYKRSYYRRALVLNLEMSNSQVRKEERLTSVSHLPRTKPRNSTWRMSGTTVIIINFEDTVVFACPLHAAVFDR